MKLNWVLPDNTPEDFVNYIIENRVKKSDRRIFFTPTFDDLPDPFLIYDLEIAAKEILNAIENKKKIFIHGDFDVDGITATSLLWDYLYRKLGADITPFIPSRFYEGYGLTENSLDQLIEKGAELIISVDCGIKDIELVNKYSDKVKFIITDHHTIRDWSEDIVDAKKVENFAVSDKALATIHPGLNSECFREISGAMVAFKLVHGINKLIDNKFDLSEYTQFAALGTVCDVMPLVDENRTIVKIGLEEMRKTKNVGLKSLFNISTIDQNSIDTYHIGFVLGPRLNAAGRLGSALDAVRLLSTHSAQTAKELATKLNNLNTERQDLTKKYFEIAEEKLLKDFEQKKIAFIYGEEWPEGIVGLIAGKLTEKYHKPILIGSLNNGIIKASARSIEGFNISSALRDSSGHLIRFGGHAQAAGLSLNAENFNSFVETLDEIASNDINLEKQEKNVYIDALIDMEFINEIDVTSLLSLAPFGMENKIPLLVIKNITLPYPEFMGSEKNHIKFKLAKFEIVGFNKREEFESLNSLRVDLAGNLDIDTWNGRTKIVFKLVHVRNAE